MDVTKKLTFEYDSDDGTSVKCSCDVTYDVAQETDRDNETELWADFYTHVEALEEEFGIHDVGFDESIELIGYNSYEIPKDQIDNHWNRFIKWFIDHSEFTVTL